MIRPVDRKYRISQTYGENPTYYKQFGLNGHEGTDFACPIGTPIYACDDGVVVRRSFSAKDYGNFVAIWHKSTSLCTWYCHLDSANVEVDQEVKKGQEIGKSGNTGNSTGPHLHWNVCATSSTGARLNTGNGYSGFLDGLAYIECPEASGISQEELDKVRAERDANWNLFLGIAEKLKKPAQKDIVYSELDQLLTTEQKLLDKDKDIKAKDLVIDQLKKEIQEMEEQVSGLYSANKESQEQIQGLTDKLKDQEDIMRRLGERIEELKKAQPVTDMTAAQLFALFLKKLLGR